MWEDLWFNVSCELQAFCNNKRLRIIIFPIYVASFIRIYQESYLVFSRKSPAPSLRFLSVRVEVEGSLDASANVCSTERVVFMCTRVCVFVCPGRGLLMCGRRWVLEVVSSLDLSASSFSSLTSPWMVMWRMHWFPQKKKDIDIRSLYKLSYFADLSQRFGQEQRGLEWQHFLVVIKSFH